MNPTLVSIELTNRCAKACPWCYSASGPRGGTWWTVPALAGFVRDLHRNGVQAVSFGGGEPLEFAGFWELLEGLRDLPVFKSVTTSGLSLTGEAAARLPGLLQKVHVSIHFPENPREVDRVLAQVQELAGLGVRSGINFVLKGRDLESEKAAVRKIAAAGIDAARVVFLPLRGKGIPVDVARVREVATLLSPKFQSTWCLLECRKSERFASVDWQGRVGFCSYTEAKTPMAEPTWQGLLAALGARELAYCG